MIYGLLRYSSHCTRNMRRKTTLLDWWVRRYAASMISNSRQARCKIRRHDKLLLSPSFLSIYISTLINQCRARTDPG